MNHKYERIHILIKHIIGQLIWSNVHLNIAEQTLLDSWYKTKESAIERELENLEEKEE